MLRSESLSRVWIGVPLSLFITGWISGVGTGGSMYLDLFFSGRLEGSAGGAG
ncbi:hypothetical protein BC826DRAFT_1025466 [Russula brevipes]|nr:hypothetical protein BC826DRAFT_1025466 [Russula brevipes]